MNSCSLNSLFAPYPEMYPVTKKPEDFPLLESYSFTSHCYKSLTLETPLRNATNISSQENFNEDWLSYKFLCTTTTYWKVIYTFQYYKTHSTNSDYSFNSFYILQYISCMLG